MIVGLFVTMGDGEKFVFLEWLADDVEANGEIVLSQAARNGKGREASEVDIDGENIAEVHLDRVIDLFSKLESWSW